MKSALIDVLCLLALCGYQALELLAMYFRFADDVFRYHSLTIWMVSCGVVFLIYSVAQSQVAPVSAARYLGLLVRMIILLLASTVFGGSFDGWLRPQDAGEWLLGVYFLSFLGLMVIVVTFHAVLIGRSIKRHS